MKEVVGLICGNFFERSNFPFIRNEVQKVGQIVKEP